jgi:hypothetical protein
MTALRGEQLFADGVIDHADFNPPVDFKGQRHAEQRQSMRKVVVPSSGSMIQRHRGVEAGSGPAVCSSPSTE